MPFLRTIIIDYHRFHQLASDSVDRRYIPVGRAISFYPRAGVVMLIDMLDRSPYLFILQA